MEEKEKQNKILYEEKQEFVTKKAARTKSVCSEKVGQFLIAHFHCFKLF